MVLLMLESQPMIQVKGQFLKALLSSNSIYDSNSDNDNNDDDDNITDS
jgi:hypothetical protein